MKITITGTPGSGKSTLGRDLAKTLGLKFLSIGEMRRQMARDMNMSLAEFNKLAEEEDWTDKEVDKYQKNYGMENDDFVVEGRLAWHFIPDSIKIFLDADEEERAKRMLGRDRPEENFEEFHEAIKANRKRLESDTKRYVEYYGVNPYDKQEYDIVLDTTGNTPEETLKHALKEIEKVQDEKHHKA